MLTVNFLTKKSFEIIDNNINFLNNFDIKNISKYTAQKTTNHLINKTPDEIREYFMLNPTHIFNSCECNNCLLNNNSILRKLPYNLFFGNDNLCLTILYGGSFYTEINLIVKWLSNHPKNKLILRIVGDYHIEEITEMYNNLNVLDYDINDENKKRRLCFYVMFIKWRIIFQILKSINKNIQVEVHANIDTIKNYPDEKENYLVCEKFNNFYFSLDNNDDYKNGMIDCLNLVYNIKEINQTYKKILFGNIFYCKKKYLNSNHIFIGSNKNGDCNICYNEYTVTDFYKKNAIVMGGIFGVLAGSIICLIYYKK
jgi:hypothetical protein